MTPEKMRELTVEIERELGREFEEISHFVYKKAELGMREFESSKYLCDYVRGKGFKVQMPYCSFDTAFRADFGDEGPTIGFLAEYDALPGYGDDKHNAHACGHNWIAATAVGSAVALAELIRRSGLKCRVALFGTPAEETYCTKVQMVEDGAFNDVDAVLQAHLNNATCTNSVALAMNAIEFCYKGRAAHAAGAPWDGINALDAVQLLYAGLNALRQHVRPNIRIHGIVTNGGLAANIVPDKASALFYVRSTTREYLDIVLEKVYNVAKGAALMTGAELTINRPELPLDNLVNVPTLQALAGKHLGVEGIKNEISVERAYEEAGSSDIGNVSHAVPTMYIETGLDSPSPVFVHEESALELVDSAYAMDALHKIVRACVGMSVELAENPELINNAKRELIEKNRQ